MVPMTLDKDSALRTERFAGKVALITGASGGQGASEARLFGDEGATVVIADVLDEPGRALAAELSGAGTTVWYRHLDVADEGAWAALVSEIDASLGRLDILVNNAGVGDQRGVIEQSLSGWERVIDINLWGPIAGMRTCAPLMARSGGGAIVNISSVAGMTGYDSAAYTASKWGLRGVTKTAAMEYAAQGIRVNSVHPGTIDTPMLAHVPDEVMDNYVRVTPMGRAGSPEEIATAVLYLASDEASFITGTELVVDGGFIAGGANRSLELKVKSMKEAAAHVDA
jgi:3alpha(or 20beta)-hydroxysteroid dehydrogenase